MKTRKINVEGVSTALSAVSNEVEVWKGIPGYEKLYQVSSFGRIKSLTFMRILTPKNCGEGYHGITLSNNGFKKRFLIHRLVGLCFIPNLRMNANEINHKDFNRKNNIVSNLEWVTREENCRHAYRNGRLNFQRSIRCDNKTGKQGVCLSSGGYQATIWHNKKMFYLGWFKELDQAIEVRNAAERRFLKSEYTQY